MIERMTVFVVLILICQGLSMVLMHMLKRRLDDMENRLTTQYRVIMECRAQIASLKLLNEARDKYMMGVKQEGSLGGLAFDPLRTETSRMVSYPGVQDATRLAMEQQEKMWKEAYKKPDAFVLGPDAQRQKEMDEAFKPRPIRDGYPTMPTGGM